LKADTHVHTAGFSDGGYTLNDVVAKSATQGCEVLAITDHLDHNLKAATPEYFAAIETARKAHPNMTILAGGEWNIPPWGGDEHATVLLAPAVETKLADFKRMFDDLERPKHDAELARQALRWLAANASAPGGAPVIVYEHPSRPDDRSADNATEMRDWRSVNDLVIGFAGAPGHQVLSPYGGYEKEQTIDRWDPAVARVGDAWDTLLGEGLDVWGAYVASDFHSDQGDVVGQSWDDYLPCEFGATWIYAPQRDALGVLQAMRAGSFFAEHGGIVRAVELLVSASGLPRSAGAGEAIVVAAGSYVNVTLEIVVPDPIAGQQTREIQRAQLIVVDQSGARIELESRPDATGAVTHSFQVPSGGAVVRARGYHDMSSGERLAFYTNPVRITAK
jgi:hypothetical protein